MGWLKTGAMLMVMPITWRNFTSATSIPHHGIFLYVFILRVRNWSDALWTDFDIQRTSISSDSILFTDGMRCEFVVLYSL
jgi:hypothetical protein